MSAEALKAALPDYAKDLKLNIGALLKETILSDQQKYGCFLACAYAIGQPDVVRSINAECDKVLSLAAKKAARSAAAIMSMNNVYFRAIHIMQDQSYAEMPAKLRMNAIGSPGIEKADFELFSMAVSAVNGCGLCMDAHEKEMREHGVTPEQIQASLRIAAVVNGASRVMAAEHAA